MADVYNRPMTAVDCLIIGSAEQDRDVERKSFLDIHRGQATDGWGRFLKLNYIEFDDDALMTNQLGSLAYTASRGDASSSGGNIEKENGFFRYQDISRMSAWRTPLLGGMFVYQYLISHGFKVELVQHVQLQADHLEASLDQQPTVIAISTTLITSPLEMKSIIRSCRQRAPDAYIVLGGMSIWNQFQVRKADRERIRGKAKLDDSEIGDLMSDAGYLGANALVVDPYGVATLAELVGRVRDGRTVEDLPNVQCFEDHEPTNVLVLRGETFDADKMRMDWDLVPGEQLGSIVNIRTQISCPFRCSFCSYPTTQGPVIKAELENFERELQALSRRGVTRLMLIDDTFNVPPKRFSEVLKILRKFEFQWFAFIRCQFLTQEHVELMKQSGCAGVYLGLESVDNETLKRMNKMATPEQFHKGIDLIASQDIAMQASFIVGFPGDTPETVMQVRDFIEKSGLDYYNFKLFWFDGATPIAQRAHEFDLTGQGYNWKHATMDSAGACELIEKLIEETKGRYVTLHSGELWEIGQFGALGLEKHHMDAIYDAHNAMLRFDLSGRNAVQEKRKIFEGLTSKLRTLDLVPSSW